MQVSAQDVDLVTVGMGGNDAKFPTLVIECMLPNLVRRALDAYPDAPLEVEYLVDKALTCEHADLALSFFKGSRIAGLFGKERQAQNVLVSIFPRA